jgi:acyl-coenzyme A synthetase/AMP-(fatty) acid ligase
MENSIQLGQNSRISRRHTASPSSKKLPKTATGKIQKYVLRARQIAIAAQ